MRRKAYRNLITNQNFNNLIMSSHFYHTNTIVLRKIILDFPANSNKIVDEAKIARKKNSLNCTSGQKMTSPMI